MPRRTTIVMPPRLKQAAVSRARAQGVSFGEFVRQAVAKQLRPEAETSRSRFIKSKAKKKGDSFWDNLTFYDEPDGPSDLSTHHDDYLYGGKR